MYLRDPDVTVYHGDALQVLRELDDGTVDACVTSPPYLDARPEYPSPSLEEFGAIFHELRRVVTGPMVLNIGRIFRNGREVRWQEDLLQAAERSGWAHLDTRIWVKPNANPIRGQVFSDSHEYVFVMGDAGALNVDAIRTPHAPSTVARFGRAWTNHRGVKNPRDSRARKTRAEPNPLGARPRSYFSVQVGREKGNPHPAPMPLEVAEELVKLASLPGHVVIDPFAGSGTTGLAARNLSRLAVLIDRSTSYCHLASVRLQQQSLLGLVS